MQKVITISSFTNLTEKGDKFNETEYPSLNKYLEEGYTIRQTIPIIKPADVTNTYAVIFILEK